MIEKMKFVVLTYLIYAAAIIYLFHFLRSLNDFRIHKDKTVYPYLGLALSSTVYCSGLFACFIHKGTQYTMFTYDMQWLGGIAMYMFYFMAIKWYLADDSIILKICLRTMQGMTIVAFASFTVHLFSDHSLFYLPFPCENRSTLVQYAGGNLNTPTTLVKITGLLLSIIPTIGIVYALSRMLKYRRNEVLLICGAVVSLVSILNDILISFGIVDGVMILFVAKAPEIFRFSHYFRVKALRKISELETELVAVSEQAAAAFITGSIVHDINNPLMIIYGRIDDLRSEFQKKGILSPETERGLSAIVKQADRISEVIKGYLEILKTSRNEDNVRIQFKDILGGAIELSSSRLKSNNVHNLKCECREDIYVNGNQTLLELVIANILNNAADAVAGETDSWIKISVSKFQKSILIQVLDSGKKPSHETVAKLFKASITSKRNNGGNGIGLLIAQKIIERHGGKIYFDDAHSNTCFAIELPEA